MVLVRKTLLILAGAMSLAASAVDEGDVLFFAPFEGESVAATAVGAPDAEIDGAVRFGSGVRGRAAILDPLTLLRYTFKDNVVPDEGTIMMWIKPEWLFSDDKFHYLFRASTGNFGGKSLNAMMLYKYGRWSRLLFYTSNGQKTDPQEGRSMAFRNELKPTPGEWVHVAATWSSTLASTEMFLYVNGERVAACGGAVFLPETIPETFSLGGPEGAGTTWFDDVLILNRPLLAAEVKHIHDASTSSTAVQSPADIPFQPSSELQIEAYPLFRCGELVVESDFRGARRALGSAPGSISVELSRGGKSLVSGSAVAGQSGLAGVSFPYAAIGPGVTQVVATLRTAAGRVLRRGELTDCLVPQRPDWVGNDLGKTDRVLPPWTPLQAREDGIAMWGREYEFAEGPLPSRIVSQGRELLRAPVAMAGRVAGKPSTLQAERSSRTSEGEAEIVREWQGMFGELTGRITQRVEFDGFMLLSLELTPTAPTVVEELHIRIPFASVSLFHHANGTWSNLSDAGGIGGAVGWQKALPFVPYVWVGDASGGLAWFCESDWNWHPRGAAHAIDLSRTGDGVDLTIRLIDEPTVLSEPLRLEFGFMATPVKPLVSGWRDWRPMFVSALNIPAFARGRRWSTPGCRNIAVLWNNHVGAFSHLPTDPQDFRTKVDTLRTGDWGTVVSYYALNQTQTETAEYQLAEKEWRRDPYGENTLTTGSCATVCAASTWADFLLYAIDRTMAGAGTDGVYLDCSNPRFCKSPKHGCAPGRYPLLATRALQKRIYALVRERHGEKGLVYSHNSENHFVTTYAFSDLVLNGEQYNRKDLRTLTAAKFRAQLAPQPYGIPAFVLPTLVKFQKNKEEKMPGAEFLAFPLLHDTICLPQWMNRDSQDLLRRVQAVQLSFGVADSEFLPYWQEAPGLHIAPAEVVVSAYRRKEPEGLLLIAQGPGKPVDAKLFLTDELSGCRGMDAVNALTGERLAWEGEGLVWPSLDRRVQIAIVGARVP